MWTSWTDNETGQERVSHSVLTCSPNEMMASNHDRMPVILDRDGLKDWLALDLTKPEDVLPYLRPRPEDFLEAYEVSTRGNNARNDGPDLIEPVAA